MKLASLLFLQQMELAMCEANFFCNWRLNILSWISILQEQHIGSVHSWQQEHAEASLNPSLPSFRTGHWRGWGRVHIFKASFFFQTDCWQLGWDKFSQSIFRVNSPNRFFQRNTSASTKNTSSLDVLIDRSQKVTQTASPNNMCQHRPLGLHITAPKPGSKWSVHHPLCDTNSPFPFLLWICLSLHT